MIQMIEIIKMVGQCPIKMLVLKVTTGTFNSTSHDINDTNDTTEANAQLKWSVLKVTILV